MVVDATVVEVLKKLAPIIEKKVGEELSLLINSNEEANQLASNFKKIQNVLSDALQVKVTDPEVRSLLDKLQDIAYDIDDALDEWDWKVQMESSSSSDNPSEKVISFLQSVCLCFRNVVERRSVNLNIKLLNERLYGLPQETKKEFNFLPNLSPDHSQDFKRTETTSFVDVSDVYGRDDEKEFLLSELLSESRTKNDIPAVISIVGVGGMGKTTLAQFLFNDQKIKDHFEKKIWVCVSDPFDEIKIAKAILEEINKKSSDVTQFQTLLRCIKDDISGKKFLLVLDDVWTEDGSKWESFREALKSGAPDSRILVTTRKTTVAQVMGSSERHICSLSRISDLDSLRVLSKIAFQDGMKECEREILEGIGWEIAQKCKGLPLAVKVIGSLLQSKSGEEEWRNVLESHWWELEKVQNGIFAPLALSYDELHPVAKRCFSYCAIFPKDTMLKPDTLIRMWCAQGYLSSITSNDDMEQKGREIFGDLARRSLFQDPMFEGNHIFFYKMHDIVHDFAQFLSKNECLIVEQIDGGANVRSARHLNLLVDEDTVNINSILIDNKKCRSFLTTEYNGIRPNLFRLLKRVRVLILERCFSEVIPSEIGSLIHLRYLDLSDNGEIKELPVAICDLYNLETLILTLCYNLSAFPQGIHKLMKLRHIFNEGTNKMEFPEGIEELTNLRTLYEIHASSRTNWKGLEFLRNMNKLDGYLKISVEGLNNEDADNHHLLLEAAKKAELKNKKFIHQLELCYSGKVPIEVMETLQPHPKLEVLRFEGPYLPKWLTTLTNLTGLTISITEEGVLAHHLSTLGNLAPSLEFLWLKNIHGMKIAKLEELYAFPKLKGLIFSDCWEWEEWEDISEEEENNIINLSIFPSLQNLGFLLCPKLKALPHRLLRRSPSLVLTVLNCQELEERYKDWERVSQIHGISHIKFKVLS